MEKVIYKYKLMVVDQNLIEMPKGAIILSVQAQENEPVIWALVNPKNKLEQREFRIFGTGNPLPSDIMNFIYIGTFQIETLGGLFVGHLHELPH